jgi:hypothetical protein
MPITIVRPAVGDRKERVFVVDITPVRGEVVQIGLTPVCKGARRLTYFLDPPAALDLALHLLTAASELRGGMAP